MKIMLTEYIAETELEPFFTPFPALATVSASDKDANWRGRSRVLAMNIGRDISLIVYH